MQKAGRFISSNWGFIVVLLFSLFSISSLFHSGFPPTHDGEYHIIRFYEFDKALRAGSWYPVWAKDLNFTYGSPLFIYIYPLPNYMASLFHLFGINFIDAFKFNLILATLVGSTTSYFLGKQKYGLWGGVLTSVFYTFAPYHLLDIYIRGSVGEVWALALFPLPLLFLNRIVKKKTTSEILLLGVSLSAIIFSHNILALMFFGFFLSYSVLIFCVSKKKKQIASSVAAGFIISFLLSSIFFIPALLERDYVVGLNTFNVLDHFPDLFELLIPSWGSGYSGAGIANQMSFQIGLANLLVVFLILLGIALKKIMKEKLYILFFLMWFFVLCFFITSYSSIFWETFSVISYFQFPWRLLSLVIFVCAVLAGSIASIYKSKILYITLLVFAIVITLQYVHPPYFFARSDSHYITRPNFIYSTNSIGNAFQTKWLSFQEQVPKSLSEPQTSLISKNSVVQTYETHFKKDQNVTFNTAYFPGWKVYIDGESTPVRNKSGKILVYVPKGRHIVTLQIEDTPVRFISKCISIITFLAILGILGRRAVIQLFYGYRHR